MMTAAMRPSTATRTDGTAAAKRLKTAVMGYAKSPGSPGRADSMRVAAPDSARQARTGRSVPLDPAELKDHLQRSECTSELRKR